MEMSRSVIQVIRGEIPWQSLHAVGIDVHREGACDKSKMFGFAFKYLFDFCRSILIFVVQQRAKRKRCEFDDWRILIF